MLSKTVVWTLILALSFGTLYAYEASRVPCRYPIEYRIGLFDERFGISETDFRAAIGDAEKPWEEALGRELFSYAPTTALFPINLVYDERQERTVASQELESSLEEKEAQQENIEKRYENLSAQYRSAQAEYETALERFNERLERYNDRVTRWNASDRSDESELERIEAEEERLRREKEDVERKRQAVNKLVPQVNALVRAGEKTVNEYNEAVSDFQERYGEGGEFDQGIYQGTDITIYQFDDTDHLRLVLAHELGHALGILHVENPQSIMYQMMEAQNVKDLRLSEEDRAALVAVCSVTATDLLKDDLKEAIRAFTRNPA